MTKAQQEALTVVTRLMEEHFNAHVIVFNFETEDDNARGWDYRYDGGGATAIGLMRLAEHDIMNKTGMPGEGE